MTFSIVVKKLLYGASVLFIDKKDGKLRMNIEYHC
jgi:hypothetical protein